MSSLPCQEVINSSDLQIWNNAAFDNGESEDSSTIRSSWCPLKLLNPSDSIDSTASKENRSPVLPESLLPVKSLALVKPLPNNCAIGNSQGKQNKVIPKQILVEKRSEQKIDDEIEEIEKEISRLSSRLKVLRVEKSEQNVKLVERRSSGRVVPAKFMKSKQEIKNTESVKKIEEASLNSDKSKMQRWDFTMGPLEIMAGMRSRGISLGPSEISAGVKSKQLGKQEFTPVCPPSARRKSCFMKLKDIDEEMGNKERKRTMSLSPNSRKAVCKTQSLRQAATTIGSKKVMKKEVALLASMQPKKLFKDGEKSVPDKKPLKQLGRVISSRYNQTTVQSASKSAMRKRSSVESDDGIKMFDRQRASSVGKSRETSRVQGTDIRVKKRWQIPSELVVANEKFEVEKSPISITAMADKLPRIKILRCANDNARDSGPAKRAAELVGKKSFFSDDEDEVPFVCQALQFDEEEVVQK